MNKSNRNYKKVKKKFDKVNLNDINKINLEKLQKDTLLPFEKKDKNNIITIINTNENSQINNNQNNNNNNNDNDNNNNEQIKQYSIQELLNKGVICLDKPKGPSSHQVSAYVQQILKIKKSGHSGTLDPKVSGILPIALNSGTKVLQALLKSGKEYICICRLHKKIDENQIKETLSRFIGKINQLPPIKSAVKRRFRTREIYYINIIEIEDQNILFRVGCQAGTYIRKLCTDIGEILDCGAHMASLRRTKAGPFNEETNKVTLQDLIDAIEFYKKDNNEKFLRHCIQPIEKSIEHLPKIWIQNDAVKTISHGASLKIPGIIKFENNFEKDQMIAIMTPKNELVCIAKSEINSNEIKNKKKGLVCKSVRVLIEPE
ncbi:RNA-guided pseudouridylation complex pseudouridine synthase subunit Cbf5 [Candidatus Woesearchaeota archaeon]|jgi:H/ACA ribonucleoprotein complex subunit 4|nr:RNA-guided pseudouridylation complex pseudouridine synthase subunit Cbf5 [Candidatus Woesearchaeota archaeon]MBT4387187.1 RNA-guided pseudouridylation complex pseudouridine synthase subunit Cbf5 [Candidatus Woesearchaeota archaeon]MBT4596056.1 RNA-guided pseudouridylation complex pseudouridine synthase subunit Cbf5 [Candidatus Woesearchaeota archaeon]MBT5740764.1 RNA-guided pseudouridylation complex pseudouridine synthase subunit Cbf5 [Candidatus Woesearchaeota archaeon]MBT6506078.1 RNA-guid